MFFASVNFRGGGVAALVLLAGISWCLRPLERVLGDVDRTSEPHVGSMGMLGGLRAAAAGATWLRAHRAWETYDPVATTAFIELAVATDGRPLFYWINGARIMAYDFPAWRIDEAMPQVVQDGLRTAGAEQALLFLEKARQMHPTSPDILIEMATIRRRVLGDALGAAHSFREAALLPGAPYYAARIHAELLREAGQSEAALHWLRQILPDLPEYDPAAGRALVVQRIKALEAELSGR